VEQPTSGTLAEAPVIDVFSLRLERILAHVAERHRLDRIIARAGSSLDYPGF
jgi:hypothetical protein